ncbi:MAG: hypothetical protein CME78_09835 [Halomonas sp.]|nr:hypothetical protein [Halomonas sp.]
MGTTTLAINLAVVAQKDFGITTNHVMVKGDSSAAYVSAILKPLRIETYTLSYCDILRSTPDETEIMIIDIPSPAAHEALSDYPKSFLAHIEKNIDILLVPADFGSRIDIANYNKFLNLSNLKPKIRFIHRPRIMETNFHQTAKSEGLDVNGENFCPFFIPQTASASPHVPPGFLEEWANKEQRYHHQDLFEYIMNMFGGATHYSSDIAKKIKSMSLIELLDHMENR